MRDKKRLFTLLHAEGTPMLAKKSNRNDPCLCGSGLKNKKCCNKDTQYYYAKKPKTKNLKTSEN